MAQNTPEKDIPLKSKMHNLLIGMGYSCLIKYDDPKRKIKDEDNKTDLLELDGAYYDTPSQCIIYLEATTQDAALTQKVTSKYEKIIRFQNKIEKSLDVYGKVEKRILLFVSERMPEGKDLELLNPSLKVVFILRDELEHYYEYLFDKIGKWLRYEFNVALGIEQKDNPILVPAIKINMSGSTVYLFELSVEKILKTCYVVRKKDLLDEGYQRIINDKKLKEIELFLTSGKSSAIFPNSILVNLNNKVSEMGCTEGNLIQLSYPMISGSYHIIDGQHRVYGYCKTGLALDQARMIVVGLKNSEPEDEIRFFLKINRTQKKIDPTLLSVLLAKINFSEEENEFWDSRAAKLVLELDKTGVYKGKIYKGAYMENKRTGEQKSTLSYMASRVEKTKFLAYRKKQIGKNTLIVDGLLQSKDQLRDLNLPVTKINSSINTIIEISEQDPKIRAFFNTNRGFDLFCRLIKAYFKLRARDKKFKMGMENYFKEIKFTKGLVDSFDPYYGAGGMAKIASITQKYLQKNKLLKKIKLTY